MSVRVYIAHKMTGRTGEDLVIESKFLGYIVRSFAPGLELLDPVTVEGVKPTKKVLANPPGKLKEFWRRDKAMIRYAHVLLDLTGSAKSEGVAHEIGYARFFLYKPVVRVYPELGPSIARIEDDIIATSVGDAFKKIEKIWGTPWKRFKWRMALLRRCFFKSLFYKSLEWINLWF